jgi:hypothetical protein
MKNQKILANQGKLLKLTILCHDVNRGGVRSGMGEEGANLLPANDLPEVSVLKHSYNCHFHHR